MGKLPCKFCHTLAFPRVFHLQAKPFQCIRNFLQENALQALHFLSKSLQRRPYLYGPAWSWPTFLALSSPLPTVFLCYLNPALNHGRVSLHRLFTESEPLHKLFFPHELLLLPLSTSWVSIHFAEPCLVVIASVKPSLIPTPERIDHTFSLHYFCSCKYLVPPKGYGGGWAKSFRFRRGVFIFGLKQHINYLAVLSIRNPFLGSWPPPSLKLATWGWWLPHQTYNITP